MESCNSHPTCWVGTNLGILKSIDIEKCGYENYFYAGETLSTVDRSLQITKLTWGEDNSRVFVGLSNGLVREFDTNSRIFSRQCNVTDNKSPLQGLHYYSNTIVSCTKLGYLSAWPFDSDPLTIRTKDVTCMAGYLNSLIVATGGEDNDLKLWDFSLHNGEDTQAIFQARNVSDRRLNLRERVFISAIDFIPNSDAKVLVTGTRYNQIRKYDTRSQRKPVLDLKLGEYPITCLSAQEEFLIVANAGGIVQLFDWRKQAVSGNLKGSAGSVRDVSYHEGYVGVCGIDRFTRVYTRDRKLVNKVYTKLEQTSILLDPLGVAQLKGMGTGEEVDELWDDIEPPAKRKKN